MTEFKPKIGGFSIFNAPDNWLISKDKKTPVTESVKDSVFHRMEVKDPSIPLILIFSADYHLEVFFFEKAQFTIELNEKHSDANMFYFEVNTISSIQFPNC